MKSIITNTDATGNMAYIIPLILIGVVLVAGSLSTVLAVGVNEILSVHNINVDAGTASQQTQDNIIFTKNIFRMLGLITVIGALIWGKVNSREESTFVNAYVFIGSIITMYLFTIFTMILVLAFGTMLDIMLPIFEGLSTTIDISSTSWSTVPDGSFAVSLVYFICQLPMLLGILVFLLSAIRRTTGESFDVSTYQTQGVD